ncbi:hypothetical protein TRL7639_03335 [Falsiruegeria litorea R37]|uniref:NAD glycohydrolase translocation F5/8 type C domain-containing protein n=1 Tax=Falsiruegeria litorea R37 TaxID=1200284 RepID=A0A1Y5TF01_9RHOB|nr:hypothetical protein [Falsiruegeria litorea]SLN60405.1 hypothetical protein TRL7639_03335 [Falsiruegeria litorea R37]
MHRGITGAFLLALGAGSAWAQQGGNTQVACTVSGCKEITLQKPRYNDASAFSVQQVWSVVNNILAVSGLLPNFQVVETGEVGNAAAIIIDGERYLAFNPDWLAQYETDPNGRWQLLGVMAHEVGHHLQGHTLTGEGSRPPTELEADEYAGFILAALGANLTEAQSLWATLPAEGSVTHPPRHQRLAAIERGWLRRQGQTPVVAAPAVPVAKPAAPKHPPPPGWAMRNCTGVTAVNRRAELCFTSVLASQSGNSYGPRNVTDGNHRTAWVEGAQGQGIGEAFTIVFNEPVLINRWSLRNGYAKSNKTYTRNSRVRELRLKFSNGKQTHFTMDDTPDWQGTSALSEYGPVSWITFEIMDVYPGTHYQDTAITELAFD